MQRLVGIACHQDNREQAEHAAGDATESVTRATIGSRRMGDLYFADTKAAIACQHRNIAMPLAIHFYLIEHLFSVAFKAAIQIVQADARKQRGNAIIKE